MPVYEWKRYNGETQEWEFDLTMDHVTPPDNSGQWQRVYSVGIGQVPGAGGSPARGANRVKGSDDGGS